MNVVCSYYLVLFLLIFNKALKANSAISMKRLAQDGIDNFFESGVEALTTAISESIDLSPVELFLQTSKDEGFSNVSINPLKPEELADTNGRIIFLLHGWSQSRTSCPWYMPVTKILLNDDAEAHVVQVEYSKLAACRYPLAVFAVKYIGHILAKSIMYIVMKKHYPLYKIVLIGHSLGSQVAGWTGKEFYKLTKMKLPRIIALDPAAPIFSIRPESRRLNKDDAENVVVIHTDLVRFGYRDNCGTIDFYPNGGLFQPGCPDNGSVWCSHRMAFHYFLSALATPKMFLAVKCDSYIIFKNHKCDDHPTVSMGDWLTTEKGTFYLNVTEADFQDNVESRLTPLACLF